MRTSKWLFVKRPVTGSFGVAKPYWVRISIVSLLVLSGAAVGLANVGSSQSTNAAADQELVNRFRPILFIANLGEPCGGLRQQLDPYDPLPVDIVLRGQPPGEPTQLRVDDDKGSKPDTLLLNGRAPSSTDLAAHPESANYIDVPKISPELLSGGLTAYLTARQSCVREVRRPLPEAGKSVRPHDLRTTLGCPIRTPHQVVQPEAPSSNQLLVFLLLRQLDRQPALQGKPARRGLGVHRNLLRPNVQRRHPDEQS